MNIDQITEVQKQYGKKGLKEELESRFDKYIEF